MSQIPETCLTSYENLCTEIDKSLEMSKKTIQGVREQGSPTFSVKNATHMIMISQVAMGKSKICTKKFQISG